MEKKIRVMFVDDEVNILRMVRRVLRNEPWELELLENAEMAWESLQKNPVDIIITDQRMNGLTGIELLARVKEAFPETLRIIFSGYTEVSTLTDAINKGHIYKFLNKPLKEDDLRLTVRRAAENVLLMRENRMLTAKIQAQNEELRKLNEELETRIKKRTQDLYIRQKALEIAQTILDNLPIAAVGIGLDETIVYLNCATSQFLQTQQGVLLGQNYQNVLPKPLQKLVRSSLQDRKKHFWSGVLYGNTIFAKSTLFQKEKNIGGVILSIVPNIKFDQEALANDSQIPGEKSIIS